MFRSWQRREIENYLVTRDALERFARHDIGDDLFGKAEGDRRAALMRECISEIEEALSRLNRPSPWSAEIKVTDEFLDPLFKMFYQRLGLPQLAFKRDYHLLAECLSPDDLQDGRFEEMRQVLMLVASKALAVRTRANLAS